MPWGTPEDIPADTVTKTLHVPNGEPWDAIVTGALYELTLAENFQQIGALTPEEVSGRFLLMWEEYIMGFSVVGGIMMWPTSAAPPNWLICDGQAVDRATYAGLFALIGTTYGVGNGTTTFNLPNLKSRFPVGVDAGNSRWNVLAENGGQESVSHTHVLNNGNTRSSRLLLTSSDGGWDNVGSSGISKPHSSGGAATFYDVVKTMDTQPVVTLPPYIALNFIICAVAS